MRYASSLAARCCSPSSPGPPSVAPPLAGIPLPSFHDVERGRPESGSIGGGTQRPLRDRLRGTRGLLVGHEVNSLTPRVAASSVISNGLANRSRGSSGWNAHRCWSFRSAAFACTSLASPRTCSPEGSTARQPALTLAIDLAFERAMQVFTAELMMPEVLAQEDFADSLASCSPAFAVSGEAMHWRLYKLGLAGEFLAGQADSPDAVVTIDAVRLPWETAPGD